MWQLIMYLCARCFQCREVYLPALETTQTAHNNEIFMILTRDFSKEH